MTNASLVPKMHLPEKSQILNFQAQLDSLTQTSSTLSPLTPFHPTLPPITSQFRTRRTHLMTIINLTPDSFSDGGLHNTTNPRTVLQCLEPHLAFHKPPTILDIGGQSTRPHAAPVTAEEELSRILPTIKLLRSTPSFNNTAISVDTYRASVASAAITAGANIVNDVSAGQLDPHMLRTIAKLGCTCILMHMRGTPETMNELTTYPTGLINEIGSELLARVREAEKAGIRRWRIMLDPGIGFAKTGEQNLELLRRFEDLRVFEGLRGLPWVVGVSRKGFIGKITGVQEPGRRGWGSAAAVTAAVSGGADVVRVHDVKEMADVVGVADAIWRV